MSMEATLATWELKKSQVNSREKFFLLSLARRAGEDHTCWPSIARMVEDTGFDRKTLIDVRQALMGRKMISYTGSMVGRSGQIPEMRLDYVLNWEKQRNSPRLKDESVDKSTVINLTGTENGTGTSTENGTGTSTENGTLNSSLEYKNRNKSFCEKDQKKHKTVNNSTDEVKSESTVTKKDWKEANQKKHSWADKQKESPRADVTKQSTSWKEEHNPVTHSSQEAVQKAMMSLPRHLRPKKYRNADPSHDTTKATELPTGTGIQPEIPPRTLSNVQGATISHGRHEDITSGFPSADGLLAACRIHPLTEEARMADKNRLCLDQSQ